MNARAKLRSGRIRLDVHFFQPTPSSATLIQVSGSGIPPGLHGFHVHESGDMSRGCESMGPHFDVGHHHHGGPGKPTRHTGDLGNLYADKRGRINTVMVDRIISLSGPRSIMNRGLVLHADPDDLGLGGNRESAKTGNSGARIACGVIRPVSN